MREFVSSFFLTIWFGPLHPSFHLPLPLLLSLSDTCPPQPPTSHVLLSVSQPFVLPKSPFAFSVSCLLQLPSLLKPFCTLVFPQVLSLLFLPPAPSVPCCLLPHSFPFSPLPLPPLSLTASLLHVFSLLSPPSFSLPRLPLLPFLGYFPSLSVPSFSPSFPLFPLLSPCPPPSFFTPVPSFAPLSPSRPPPDSPPLSPSAPFSSPTSNQSCASGFAAESGSHLYRPFFSS